VRETDYVELLQDVEREVLASSKPSVGVLGLTGITLRLLASLTPSGLIQSVQAIYARNESGPGIAVPLRGFAALREVQHDLLVVAADEEKEELLHEALPYIQGTPKIIVGGYGHLEFRDPVFQEELRQLLVPSLATGYPNSLVHLYQCLGNAARLRLEGVVAEFGMFKGGTTMFLSRTIERLERDWRVIGFDTFDGFPPRRSPLDMYDNPACKFTDLRAVQRYLDGRNIEVVPGDIVETAGRLADEAIVLSFIDTDNSSSAWAALDIVRERTVVGGAIVFDHFTGVDRFRYTLGERIAGSVLLTDMRYFHLHGTGVFYRQR